MCFCSLTNGGLNVDGNGSELPGFRCASHELHALARIHTKEASFYFRKYFHTQSSRALCCSGHFCVLRGRLSTENCLPLLPDRSDGPALLRRLLLWLLSLSLSLFRPPSLGSNFSLKPLRNTLRSVARRTRTLSNLLITLHLTYTHKQM